jgi:PAS domain S-box-containing protein
MKIKKNALIRSYAQSMGIEAAKELITKKIKSAALEEKERYTEEETVKICSELIKEGGLISIVAQNLVIQLERKRSEEQTLLLDNIENQIWYLTDKETYGIVNKAHAEFLGLEKEKLEGRDLYDIISVEEADVCIANNREVFEKKKQSHTEEWVKNGRGETRLLSITRTPKLDDKGDVEYVICAAEDIAERKRMEKALKESEEKYRTIFESIQDVYAEVAIDGTILEISPSILSFGGYTPEEVLGRSLSGFYVYPEQRAALMERLHLDSKLNDYEVVLRHKTGRKVPCSFTVKVVTGNSGIPVKTVGTMRDITERKQTEEELKNHREHLEELVKERTAELEEKNKELKRFNKLFVNREFRIKELRDKVKEMEKQIEELNK